MVMEKLNMDKRELESMKALQKARDNFKKITQELVGPNLVVDDRFLEDLEVEIEFCKELLPDVVGNRDYRAIALENVCADRGYYYEDEEKKFVRE